MVDQRKDKRAPASLKVKYKSATVDQFIEQFGTDVSRGGIFIKTKKPLEAGALLKLELQLSDASPVIHGIGRVVFRRETPQEPNLPAGMGIKFIKLDPGSRAIVERIVNARGDKPSRFDQTEGAELAPASLPPEADEFGDLRLSGAPQADAMSLSPAPPSAKPPAAAPAPRARPAIEPARSTPAPTPAPAAARPPLRPTPSGLASPAPAASTPAAAPRPGSGSRPFPRSGSGANANPIAASATGNAPRTPPIGSSKPERFPALEPSKPGARAAAPAAPKRAGGVAGLFADSPIAQSVPAEPAAKSNGRSSFFPPAPDEAPGPAPARGRARDLESQKPPFTPRGPAEAARAEQARHSGEFLATAFEQGGATRATTEQARVNAAAAQTSGEDSLIDELFAGVVDPEASAPARNGAAQNSVDDMFAELSQEEGLAGARRSAPSADASAAKRAAAAAPPPMRKSQPGRASDADNVDDLFAELNAPSRPPPGKRTPLPAAPPPSGAPPSFSAKRAQPAAESLPPFGASDPPVNEAEWTDGGSNEEADLGAGEAPVFSEPPRLEPADALPQGAPAELDAPKKRPASAAILIGLAALVLVAGGGYVYYSRVVQPAATVAAVPLPKISNEGPHAPAPAEQPPGAAPTHAPAATGAEIEVEITATPRGADVIIDGKRQGLAPTRVKLAQGQAAQITVSSSGFASMTKTVTPAAGQEPLRFKLDPLPYSLRVRTIPDGAELTAGTARAIAPGPLDLGHLDGGVLVSVAKAGFQRMTRPVRLDEFTEQDGVMRAEIEVRLTELPRGAEPVRARIRRRPDEPPAPEAPPAPPEEPAPSAPAAPAAEAPAPAAPAAAPPAAPEPPPGLPELPADVKPAEAAP